MKNSPLDIIVIAFCLVFIGAGLFVIFNGVWK